MGRPSGTTLVLAVLLAFLVLAFAMLQIARFAAPTPGVRTVEIHEMVATLQTWFGLETRLDGAPNTRALRWFLGLVILAGSGLGVRRIFAARRTAQADASKRS